MAYVIGDGCIKCGSCAANCPVSAGSVLATICGKITYRRVCFFVKP